MGREKKALPGCLELDDRVKLGKIVHQECADYKAKVSSIYNDDYQSCDMMSK